MTELLKIGGTVAAALTLITFIAMIWSLAVVARKADDRMDELYQSELKNKIH